MIHDGPANLGKSQRQHGQVHARQAHAEPAVEQRTGCGDQRPEQQRRRHRQIKKAHQQGRAISPEPEIRRMAKTVHAARPKDEVQTGCKQCGNKNIGQQHGAVTASLTGKHGQQHQPRHQRHPCRTGTTPRRAQRQLMLTTRARQRLRLAQQAPGAPDQHHGHDEKLHHQRKFGERNLHPSNLLHTEPDAEGLEFGHQQRGDKGTGNAAHAAHHHHDKGRANGQHVHLKAGRLTRQLQRTAQPGQQRTQRKHGGKQPCLIDAQRTHHFTVLRGGAHQGTKAGFC